MRAFNARALLCDLQPPGWKGDEVLADDEAISTSDVALHSDSWLVESQLVNRLSHPRGLSGAAEKEGLVGRTQFNEGFHVSVSDLKHCF